MGLDSSLSILAVVFAIPRSQSYPAQYLYAFLLPFGKRLTNEGEGMRAIFASALLFLHLSASLAAGEPLLIFDAQGKFVGLLEDYGGPGVYLMVANAIAFVPIERVIVSGDGGPQTVYSATEFRWSGTNAADYTSSDCSGAPVITLIGGVRPSLTIRQGTDVTLYVAPTTNSGPIRIGSTRSGPNFNCVPSGVPSTEYGWPTESTYSLNGAHPEPLTIRYPRRSEDRRYP